MLSKSQISLVKSLHQKKFRKEEQLFIVEGLKSILEFLNSSFVLHTIYATSGIFPKLANLSHKQKVFEVSDADLLKISTLKQPQGILAIFQIPENEVLHPQIIDEMTFVLDGIQDPGNLGTIIRTADWFGFKRIICSENTVEAFNPKVVQATMGSLSRVQVHYQSLVELLKSSPLPKFGALLSGNNLFDIVWPKAGFLILGSEGNGISEDLLPIITQPITIPGSGNTESLNVAISAAICMAELQRNILK